MLKLQVKDVLLSVLFFLPIAGGCQESGLQHINALSRISNVQGNLQVIAPYTILSEATYTTDVNIYEYKNHDLKIIDKTDPDKIRFKVTKKNEKTDSANKDYTNTPFPWWSTSAPIILKQLDFSQVDGKSKHYNIGAHHRLTLLGEQGHWGMVYVLEDIQKNKTPEKICAVKLLLTKNEKSMDTQTFRQRHKKEIDSNLQIAHWELDIDSKPYGIIKNDDDHYLLFLEYGESVNKVFKAQPNNLSIDQLDDFISQVDALHHAGYAHGDLKMDNMLIINNKIKLCDWFSLTEFTKTKVGEYRYIGDNLPPEAIRAFYFGKDTTLSYAIVTDQGNQKLYLLHPITADRFCLGIDLLQIIAPDLYKGYYKLMPKDFNPYRPNSLDFWKKHTTYILKIQKELLLLERKTEDIKKRQLIKKISAFINVDPIERSSIQQLAKSKVQEKFQKIEALYNGRLGVSAINTGNNKRLQYRADERFPFSSTFKVMAAAAILKESMKDSSLLEKHITYSKEDTIKAGYAPITEKHLSKGMSISELCAAAIQHSDNAAVNFMMKELGGPKAVTAFARSIGDDTFRLDRWEPGLNTAIPGDLRDTSTPAAMEKSLQALLIGDALGEQQREQLQDWLKGNTTGKTRIRSGVPEGWIVGDKTGTSDYGTTNDIGIIWPPNGAPIIVAIYFTQKEKNSVPHNEVISSATQVLVNLLMQKSD
jgi:beta-lactamase class A